MVSANPEILFSKFKESNNFPNLNKKVGHFDPLSARK